MIHFITYGNYKYKRQKDALSLSAKRSDWFDTVTVYGPSDLDDNFTSKCKHVLEEQQGGGCWIWKPYIISKNLNEISDNDVLIYLDAGCELSSKSLGPYTVTVSNQSDLFADRDSASFWRLYL